jgi:hypothetical protein
MLLQFFAKKFKNLDEVRKNKDRLATHAEHRKAVEDISTEFYHLASELEKEDETYDYFSNEMGVALATLEESDNAIKEKLTRYKLDNSDEAVNKIKGLQQMLKDVVTDYFEAKPRRIVRLNEFSGVIVPVGKQYDEVADTLAQQFGLKVERYDDSQQYNTALNNIKGNDNTIFFQSQLTDKISRLFKPLFGDGRKFADALRKAIKGEVGRFKMLQVLSNTPEVYKRLGIEDKVLNLPMNILKKINVGKHSVPLDVIEKLPELIANPLMVLDSKTESGSLVSILDEVDADGNTIVAVIKPTDTWYNVIPSVYGKEQIESLINSSNVRYVNDTENPTKANYTLASLQLRGGVSARGDNVNIINKSDIVNTILQQTANTPDTADSTYYQNTQGFFDSDLKAIVIGDNFNFGTLPHELSHFWLDKTFEIWKSGKGTERFFVNFDTM